jgi:hypothetical protein
MKTAARPIPTVRRSSLERTMARFLSLPEVDDVLLTVSANEPARLTVCWASGRTTPLAVTEDA